VPKKYFIHISGEELRKLFNEVVAVFDYERSDVNTEELISGLMALEKELLEKQVYSSYRYIIYCEYSILTFCYRKNSPAARRNWFWRPKTIPKRLT